MDKNNMKQNSGGGSWKQVKPPSNAPSSATATATTTTTTTTTTSQSTPSTPNKGWKSGRHADAIDMVSILSAPPPTTRRVFDPMSMGSPSTSSSSTSSPLNTSSNSSFKKKQVQSPLTIHQNAGDLLKDEDGIDFDKSIESLSDFDADEVVLNGGGIGMSTDDAVDKDVLKKILEEEDDDYDDDHDLDIEDILNDHSIDDDDHDLLNSVLQQRAASPLKQTEEQERKLHNSNPEGNQLPMLWRFKNSRKSVNGIVVEPQSYSKISEQLVSEEIRKVVGLPTCFSVAKYIAIGTSHGYLMIFNYNQELLSIIGGSIVADCGPVTAADFPRCKVNEDWLISGHQSGHVLLWDITTGKPIKVIDKIHKCAISHLKFFADGQRFISSDAQGITFVVSIVKGFMAITVDQQLLLNGNLGPILSIQPLLPGNYMHPTDKSNIVALATNRKILVISATTEGVFILNNKITKPKYIQSQSVLPYLSWRRVTFQKSIGHTKPLEPILAIGWGTNIQLLQIVTAPTDTKFMHPEFIVVAEYQTDFDICGLEWLDQIILFQNSKDELRVFDPFALEEVESINIKSMQLVHQKSKKKDSTTSVYSFHNSIRANRGRIYFLGLKGVFTAHILTWLERLSILISNHQYFEALCLALDFYEGKAKATTGLSVNTVDLKVITGEKISEILSQFCFVVFNQSNLSHSQQQQGQLPRSVSTVSLNGSLIPKSMSDCMDKDIEHYNQFQQLALITIEFCVLIKKTDLLFGEVFNYYVEAGMTGTFLEFLEPYILNDRLTHLNPEVMQYMMSHYQEKGILIRAEQCVLHLDISSIDFHSTILLCRKHGLFSALIYLYNKGLNDYITPMEDMMEVINQSQPVQEQKNQVAYRLLLYLQYCLSGRSFPNGQIEKSRIVTLKSEVYEYLYLRNIHPEDQTPYPRLYQLLKLDTTECLKILSPGFYDQSFWTSSPKDQNSNPHEKQISVPNLPLSFPINRSGNSLNNFNMISILLLIMIDKSQTPFDPKENPKWNFDIQNQGQLLCLLGRCFADNLLNVDMNLFNRIIGILSVPPVTNTPLFTSQDRQKVLLDILQKKEVESSSLDIERLITSFEGNDFYQLCKYLYSIKKNYNKMIIYHMKDSELKSTIFEYIKQLLADSSLNDEQISQIRHTTISNLAQLILIDSSKTAQLIMDCFSNDHEKILKELSNFPKLQYTYLQGLIVATNTTSNTSHQSPVLPAKNSESKIHISSETHELYIRLMCMFQPDQVYPYLSTHDDYPLDSSLKICQQYNNFHGAVFLLERTSDIFKALDMYLNLLRKKIEDLIQHFTNVFANVKQLKSQSNHVTPQEKEVRDDLNSAISLCQRNSPRLQDQENESLWFKLFDTIVIYIKQIKINNANHQINQQSNPNNQNSSKSATYTKTLSFLTKLSHMILNSMMGYVALPVILSKIVNEYGSNEYGDFKNIISDMLDTCSFETSILEAANQLIQIDMYNATSTLVNKLNRAYLPAISKCGMCYRPLYEFSNVQPSLIQQGSALSSDDAILIFHCDHAFHRDCLGKHTVCPICTKEKESKKSNNNNSINTPIQSSSQLDAQKVALEQERDKRETFKYLERLKAYENQNNRKPVYNLDHFDRNKGKPGQQQSQQQSQNKNPNRQRRSKPVPPTPHRQNKVL